jgi:hypothetical protein
MCFGLSCLPHYFTQFSFFHYFTTLMTFYTTLHRSKSLKNTPATLLHSFHFTTLLYYTNLLYYFTSSQVPKNIPHTALSIDGPGKSICRRHTAAPLAASWDMSRPFNFFSGRKKKAEKSNKNYSFPTMRAHTHARTHTHTHICTWTWVDLREEVPDFCRIQFKRGEHEHLLRLVVPATLLRSIHFTTLLHLPHYFAEFTLLTLLYLVQTA